jgi:ring-1,2-phenylacetyl-CoA epoxidase subunit PaaC
VALDLLGQTQSYLSLAGALLDGKSDDDLAFHRNPDQYQNLLLVEQLNGHFGDTICRQFLFDRFALLRAQHLAQQNINTDISAIAAKAVKEIRYHVDHSSKWMVRLGDGTAESHTKIQQSLNELWQFTDEMFTPDASDLAGVASGLLPDFNTVKSQWLTGVTAVLSEAGLTHPENVQMQLGGRSGDHTPHLAVMLEEMQVLPRLHPDATW